MRAAGMTGPRRRTTTSSRPPGPPKARCFTTSTASSSLGYAVVDEIIGPLLLQRWLEPVQDSTNPLSDLQAAFRRYVATDIGTGAWLNGCPMNNLAQEMSPLDDGFYGRINRLYDVWRARYTAALERGMAAGTVKAGISAPNLAALIVAAQMGIWGTGKSSRNQDVMRQAAEGLCDYLESLRP
jgi:hypothetical protein